MIKSTQKIPGGTVYEIISPSDPYGSLRIQCDRHKEYVAIVDNNFTIVCDPQTALRMIYDAAVEALALCPDCVEEKKPKPMCSQEEHDACGCQP